MHSSSEIWIKTWPRGRSTAACLLLNTFIMIYGLLNITFYFIETQPINIWGGFMKDKNIAIIWIQFLFQG